MQEILATRNAQIAALTAPPLPGSTPYNNFRPMSVPERFDRCTLLEMLATAHPHVAKEEWQRVCNAGEMLQHGKVVAGEKIVRSGERYHRLFPNTVEPNVNAVFRVLYEDDFLVAIEKPAPLPMHPCGCFNRNTLTHFLDKLYAPNRLHILHRLDANTSGIVLFARTKAITRLVHQQFANREVEKTYLARVQGQPAESQFVCTTSISPKPAADAGIRLPDVVGLSARTEFRLVQFYSDGTSLLEASPITGRTHQIRIHLWELGLPVCGDPAYLLDNKNGKTQTLSVEAPPLCLHAQRLQLLHPKTAEILSLESTPPAWVNGV